MRYNFEIPSYGRGLGELRENADLPQHASLQFKRDGAVTEFRVIIPQEVSVTSAKLSRSDEETLLGQAISTLIEVEYPANENDLIELDEDAEWWGGSLVQAA